LHRCRIVFVEQFAIGDVDRQLAIGKISRQRHIGSCTAEVQLNWGKSCLCHVLP
jgi:hypothetical protein